MNQPITVGFVLWSILAACLTSYVGFVPMLLLMAAVWAGAVLIMGLTR